MSYSNPWLAPWATATPYAPIARAERDAAFLFAFQRAKLMLDIRRNKGTVIPQPGITPRRIGRFCHAGE